MVRSRSEDVTFEDDAALTLQERSRIGGGWRVGLMALEGLGSGFRMAGARYQELMALFALRLRMGSPKLLFQKICNSVREALV